MIYAISTDNGNGQPVPGAVITFARGGQVFNTVEFPNNTGTLYFDSVNDADLFKPDVSIRVEAAGYTTAGTSGNAIHGDWVFTLRGNGLQRAVLVGGLLVGGVFVLSSLSNRRKKRIAGIDVKKDVLPWLPVAVIGVGGYLAYQFFFGKSQGDKDREDALNKDIANAEANEPSRMSDSEISTTVNALVEDLTYSHPFGDGSQQLDASHQLTKAGTTADLLRLIKAYGKHMITYFGIPAGEFTLEETVTRKLDADVIAELNNYYKAQGVDFQF